MSPSPKQPAVCEIPEIMAACSEMTVMAPQTLDHFDKLLEDGPLMLTPDRRLRYAMRFRDPDAYFADDVLSYYEFTLKVERWQRVDRSPTRVIYRAGRGHDVYAPFTVTVEVEMLRERGAIIHGALETVHTVDQIRRMNR